MALGFEVFVQSFPAGDGTSNTISLSTSGTNRIALLFVNNVSVTTRRTVTSVTDANGLTWHLYQGLNYNTEDATIFGRLEIWWAYCAAQQSANTVTVTISGTAHGPNLGIGSVSGVPPTRFTNPFDVDPSLPGTATNPSATAAAASFTFSTHDSADVSFAVLAGAVTTSASATAPTGYTQLVAINNLVSFSRVTLYVFAKVLSAQQVGTFITMGNSVDNGTMTFAVGGDLVYPHMIASTPGF